MIDEARDFHLMPDRRELLPSFKFEKRCCNHILGHIFAVGGLTKSGLTFSYYFIEKTLYISRNFYNILYFIGDSQSTVEVFDPVTGKWSKAEAMSMLRSRVGVAVMNNKLYAVGGYNGSERLSTAEVFNPTERVWSRVSSMHFNRR